ncbi:MAG: GNAT family N-acetyltransferase [Cyclobacteriaceae bacterium]
MDKKLTYRKFNNSVKDVRLVGNCFNQNNLQKDFDQLEWMYLMGKDGPLESFLAFDDNKAPPALAGIYALFPVTFKIGGENVKALQSLDTLTDSDYRGMGLFSRLSSMTYRDCSEEGYQMIYGFPNENSAHGFFNKLGWVEVADVPFMILPINLKYFISRLPIFGKLLRFIPAIRILRKKKITASEIRTLDHFDHSIDTLWNKFRQDINISVDRNQEYLYWRYIKKPRENYIIKGLFLQGVLEALIIYAVKEKHDGRIGYIMEFIYNPKKEQEALELMKYARNELLQSRIDVCLAWVFDHSISYPLFKKLSFFKLPKSLRPIQLHFGYKNLNLDAKADPGDSKNWYLSYSDSDTV